jgi:hypothetical protein
VRQLGEVPLESRQRDVEGTRHVAETKLILRAHVEHGHQAVAQPPQQILARDGLKLVAGTEVGRHHPLDLRHVALAHASERLHQPDDFVPAGKAVEHPLALPPRLHQPGTP